MGDRCSHGQMCTDREAWVSGGAPREPEQAERSWDSFLGQGQRDSCAEASPSTSPAPNLLWSLELLPADVPGDPVTHPVYRVSPLGPSPASVDLPAWTSQLCSEAKNAKGLGLKVYPSILRFGSLCEQKEQLLGAFKEPDFGGLHL